MKTAEFDYIVVGAGAAGCVIAARLAEDASVRVGLFEAGQKDSALTIRIPAANVTTGTEPRYNWSYQSEPVAQLGGRQLYWAQGRIVGGSGSINGMMYMRGHRSDYDGWAANGCHGWSYDDVLPYFRKAETNERGASDLHGGSGPLQVSAGRATAPICDMFLEAASASGHSLTDDLNKDVQEAFGHVDMTIGDGLRSSTSTAYLRPALKRGKISLSTNTLVTRIIIENGIAKGIEFIKQGECLRAWAAKSVILCGGAVNSPQLLMLSGVGEPDELRALDIPILADLPQVGKNLQNHPMYRLMYTTTASVSAYSYLKPSRALAAGLQYMFGRTGVLSRGLFPTSGFFHNEPGNSANEIQVCMAPVPIVRRKSGLLGILPQEHGFTLLLNHGSPFSRGTVRLKSADPTHHAAINPNYFSDPRDIGILARGTRRVHELVRSGPLGRILDREIAPQKPTTTIRQIEDDIRRNAATHYHPVGTCRMGSDTNAVVDTRLRVRGVDNLHVADASIMPVLINGNTYAATIMIAEKAAHLIRSGNHSNAHARP